MMFDNKQQSDNKQQNDGDDDDEISCNTDAVTVAASNVRPKAPRRDEAQVRTSVAPISKSRPSARKLGCGGVTFLTFFLAFVATAVTIIASTATQPHKPWRRLCRPS